MGLDYHNIVPYGCIYLDATLSDLGTAAIKAFYSAVDPEEVKAAIQAMWTNSLNPNPVLPCLSVRTGLDLYLRVMNFPQGSEVIMSALNIPDMSYVVRYHGLKVVPLDINIETCSPKVELLPHLITDRTVALLLAHIYGKWFDIEPFIEVAAKHKLAVIEDCAENFCGFQHIGHCDADISLFSFGTIKNITAFGGAVAKVKSPEIYKKMVVLYSTYEYQTRLDYLRRVMKCSMIYPVKCPALVKPGIYLTHMFGINHKKYIVKMLRGFPNNLIERIRHQPSAPLLDMMLYRMRTYKPSDLNLCNIKCDYVNKRLMENVIQIGNKALIRNNWLFPIIVEYPDDVTKMLNAMGVDAYRGATQLDMVEGDHSPSPMGNLDRFVTHYPHETKFLIDHVVYLPVNKLVPFEQLDRILSALVTALKSTSGRPEPLAPSSVPKVTSKL